MRQIASSYFFNYFCMNNTTIIPRFLTKSQHRKLSWTASNRPVVLITTNISMTDKKQRELLISQSNEKMSRGNHSDARHPPLLPRFWSKQRIALTTIALISTTTAVNASSSSSGLTENFVLTPDAAYWKKVGEEIAHRDLDLFDQTIAAQMAAGSSDYRPTLDAQLILLEKVIKDVGDNNRQLIPNIINVIEKLNDFLGEEGQPSPSIWKKVGLKGLIWYVDGKRDNKSYYLLDGAQLWSSLRIKILKKYLKGKAIDELSQELGEMQKNTAALRDSLDDMAQIFVKGIKRIHSLVGDVDANLSELRKTAKHLLEVSAAKDAFLTQTKELEQQAEELVATYK